MEILTGIFELFKDAITLILGAIVVVSILFLGVYLPYFALYHLGIDINDMDAIPAATLSSLFFGLSLVAIKCLFWLMSR